MDQKHINRFNSNVAKGSSCHIWLGALDTSRYGRFSVNGKELKAHRFSWSLKHGSIPEGMMICHKCDNPSCVNVDHLFLGTQFDNMRDMHSKNRHTMRNKSWVAVRRSYSGDKNPNARFTAEDVKYIRASDQTAPALAERFGVHRNLIYDIRKHKTWKDI